MLAKDHLTDEKEKFQCVSNPAHLLTPTCHVYPFNAQRSKMSRNTLKILHQMLQDLKVCPTILGGYSLNG